MDLYCVELSIGQLFRFLSVVLHIIKVQSIV